MGIVYTIQYHNLQIHNTISILQLAIIDAQSITLLSFYGCKTHNELKTFEVSQFICNIWKLKREN